MRTPRGGHGSGCRVSARPPQASGALRVLASPYACPPSPDPAAGPRGEHCVLDALTMRIVKAHLFAKLDGILQTKQVGHKVAGIVVPRFGTSASSIYTAIHRSKQAIPTVRRVAPLAAGGIAGLLVMNSQLAELFASTTRAPQAAIGCIHPVHMAEAGGDFQGKRGHDSCLPDLTPVLFDKGDVLNASAIPMCQTYTLAFCEGGLRAKLLDVVVHLAIVIFAASPTGPTSTPINWREELIERRAGAAPSPTSVHATFVDSSI
mmetsp:Transcript_99370/g.290047  ORF Transcript_99370/g.290047 Transcript_99370/m.290047 type:complete len:262 (+) Transcript_99370:361-1146(+)